MALGVLASSVRTTENSFAAEFGFVGLEGTPPLFEVIVDHRKLVKCRCAPPRGLPKSHEKQEELSAGNRTLLFVATSEAEPRETRIFEHAGFATLSMGNEITVLGNLAVVCEKQSLSCTNPLPPYQSIAIQPLEHGRFARSRLPCGRSLRAFRKLHLPEGKFSAVCAVLSSSNPGAPPNLK